MTKKKDDIVKKGKGATLMCPHWFEPIFGCRIRFAHREKDVRCRTPCPLHHTIYPEVEKKGIKVVIKEPIEIKEVIEVD